MAEYLNEINTFLVYIFLLFYIIIEVKCMKEYIPAIIWTSKEFEESKNVDYMVMKEIKSDLFESYLMELLKGQKALIVVFLENDLGSEDFIWKDKAGESHPFFTNLKTNSRVDYFQSIEFPFQTVVRLYREYNKKHFKPGNKFNFEEKDLVFVEFQKIDSQRSEAIRNHICQIEDIHGLLLKSRKNWICIYTAKNFNYIESKSKKLNTGFGEEQLKGKPSKSIFFHRDECTGLTYMTKGSIKLHLPSQKSSTIKILEDYLGASVKSSQHKIDFVFWFLNYTLTFHLKTKETGEWKIEGAKLLTVNGDPLVLTFKQEDFQQENNYYIEATELKVDENLLVKIILPKYKFLRFHFPEELCKKYNGFLTTFSIIILSIFTVVLCWKKLLDKLDFSLKGSVVKVPTENLLIISSKNVLKKTDDYI